MYPGLVSCPFYAIPIYPFKFMKFFIYLSPFIFLLLLAVRVIERSNNFFSLVPRPFEGKAWGLLRAHARKISRIISRKISDNDVIVHGESARKEYADTFVYNYLIGQEGSVSICYCQR